MHRRRDKLPEPANQQRTGGSLIRHRFEPRTVRWRGETHPRWIRDTVTMPSRPPGRCMFCDAAGVTKAHVFAKSVDGAI